MNELEIIANLKKIINNPSALNLTDDVFFDKKKSLLASIDTYNENVHYLNFEKPDLIIKKVIRSSISDIISKGADPKYLLVSFSGSKKQFNKKNVKLIINSMKQEQKKYNFSLVGGDITSSKKSSFTICTFGFSKIIVKRNNCFLRDEIYITGNIGDSSVGLALLKRKLNIKTENKNYFIEKYYKPNLAYGFHKDLQRFATSSIDISDGLLVDMKKLIGKKKLSFILDLNLIPLSSNLKKLILKKKVSKFRHLFKGDDYQIIFTAKNKYRKNILKYAKKWNQKITRIGIITNGVKNYLKYNNKLNKINDYQGYIHNFK
tara:strand:- start:8243 stop:9196 length:954 start_codon:yes stop_codon:yes gene_type:complete